MKRSEAVNLLLNEILINTGKDYKELDYDGASSILTKLEEIGMLPPTIKLSHINAYDNGWESE